MRSPAAESLDTYGSGPGVKIGEPAAFHARREDIEKGLPQPVAGWPSSVAAWSEERS